MTHQTDHGGHSGFRYTLKAIEKDDVEDTLIAANADPEVDGIIVYYPIFNNRQDQYLQQIVDVAKDVEGLSHRYIFNMYQNIRFLDDAQSQKSILPCTPLAVVKVLEYLHVYNPILPYGNRLFGHTICVVNRSEVVGRPLAALLANDGACVYSVDITGVQQFTRGEGIRKRKHEVMEKDGWGLEDCVPLCDVVVTGVPGEMFKFPCHLLRDGAVCVNFSSEKVSGVRLSSFTGSPLSISTPDKAPSELWTGGQTKSFDLCACHRQGDYSCAAPQSLAHCTKSESDRTYRWRFKRWVSHIAGSTYLVCPIVPGRHHNAGLALQALAQEEHKN